MAGYLVYRLHFRLVSECGEGCYVLLARLHLKARKIYRMSQHTRRRAGLEATYRHARIGKRASERRRREKTVRSRGIIAVAHKNAAVKVSTGSDHNGVALPLLADCGRDARHAAAPVAARFGLNADDLSLHGVKVRRHLERVLHYALIKTAVRLDAL